MSPSVRPTASHRSQATQSAQSTRHDSGLDEGLTSGPCLWNGVVIRPLYYLPPTSPPKPPAGLPLRRAPKRPLRRARAGQNSNEFEQDGEFDIHDLSADQDLKVSHGEAVGDNVWTFERPIVTSGGATDDLAQHESTPRPTVTPAPRRSRPPAVQVLACSGLPGAGPLVVAPKVGKRNARETLRNFATVLLSAARCASAKSPFGVVATAAVQTYLATLSSAPIEPMTLGSVKALLMACSEALPPVPPNPPEEVQIALSSVPLIVMHATRPRSAAQRRQTEEPLRLVRDAYAMVQTV